MKITNEGLKIIRKKLVGSEDKKNMATT